MRRWSTATAVCSAPPSIPITSGGFPATVAGEAFFRTGGSAQRAAQAAVSRCLPRNKARAINLIAEGDYVVAEVRGDVQTKAGKRYEQ